MMIGDFPHGTVQVDRELLAGWHKPTGTGTGTQRDRHGTIIGHGCNSSRPSHDDDDVVPSCGPGHGASAGLDWEHRLGARRSTDSRNCCIHHVCAKYILAPSAMRLWQPSRQSTSASGINVGDSGARRESRVSLSVPRARRRCGLERCRAVDS
jgi:hypothetical protein